jgi:hypothetical protein
MALKKRHFIHELGRVCNICSDYDYTIEVGTRAKEEGSYKTYSESFSTGQQ